MTQIDEQTARALQAEYKQVQADLRQTGDQLRQYARRTEESTGLISARLQDLEQQLARGEGDTYGASAGGSLAAMVAEQADTDPAFQHLQSRNQGTARLAMPNLTIRQALTHTSGSSSDGGGSMPSTPGFAGIFGPVSATPRLLNFLHTRSVTNDAVTYVQISAEGDAQLQDAEGDLKAAVELSGTPRRAPIATVAAFCAASVQALSDHGQLQTVIEGILRARLLDRLTQEIISGSGLMDDENPTIRGLMLDAVHVLPAAQTLVDRIGQVISEMRGAGYTPGVVVMNPMVWFTEVQQARSAVEQIYLFGSPLNPAAPSIWGVPVALEPAVDHGAALVIDLDRVELLDREQASVLLSNSHADFFRRNLVAIRAELRAGLMVTDAGACWIIEPDSNAST